MVRSDWATPIVVVYKKDGGIRICDDFKVSINPVLETQTYPLSTPEEMFSTLANGELYTKLDLARAYKRLKVKQECWPLLTLNTHCGLYQYTRFAFCITTANHNSTIIVAKGDVTSFSWSIYYSNDNLVIKNTPPIYVQCSWESGIMASNWRSLNTSFFAKNWSFGIQDISCCCQANERPCQEYHRGTSPYQRQELQSFLGMLTYNAKFLPNMSHTLHPLHQLMLKNIAWV